MEILELPTFRHPPTKSLWNQRVELISGRCYFVLEKQGISRKDIRSYVRAMAKWFGIVKLTPKGSDSIPDFSLPYARPVSNTIWDERFDITKSIVNQPVTKQFLQMIGSQKQLPDHRYYGYVAALALLDKMHGLMGTRPEDLDAFENFGGPHEEGGTDWTALELDDERNTMMENMLGKAEEFVFKADVLTEQAELGKISSRPTEKSWEPRVEKEIKRMGARIEKYRFKSGEKEGTFKFTPLADYLHTQILSDNCPRQFPKNPKTIRQRLPEILARLNI